MIPKRAIKLALEGGWKFRNQFDTMKAYPDDGFIRFGDGQSVYFAEWCEFALDPAFWRALGKALNWPSDDPDEPIPPGMRVGEWKRQRPWGRAMRFFDIVMTGENLTAYWNEILP
jgi:hypothetical protein